jgi:DHA2 family multidrug resistance protein-like MFS transporter
MTAHALSAFFLVGMQFLIAQHLQLVLGLSPLEAGLWTLPGAAGGIAGSLLAPALVRHFRPASGIAGGLLFGAAGFALFARIEADSGFSILVAGYVVTALAVGLVTTLTTDLIISAAPPERTGAASGIEETGIEFGIAMGVAVLGSVGTAVYRNRLADTIPEGTPTEAGEAASDTLGGAVAAAERLPGRTGAELLDAAREAFVAGLQLNALVSAACMVALAALAAILLRRVPAHPDRDGASDPDRHGATVADQVDVGESDRGCDAGSRVGGR